MMAKMTNWLFVSELYYIKDALKTLKALSLFLERRDATAITAKGARRKMDQTLTFKEEYTRAQTFKGVTISEPTETQHIVRPLSHQVFSRTHCAHHTGNAVHCCGAEAATR